MRAGNVVTDRFELLEAVGSGGMGNIFRARDASSGALVAVKVLREELPAARFDREAEVLARLRHPAIVTYVAHGALASGDRYLAMEWLEGEDLARRLARGRLSVDETIALGTRLCDAVAAAHAQGIVHRDLKPSNLFLVGGQVEQAKVLDFGIAQIKRTTRMTKKGALLGTLGYMAPEQARGAVDIDARVDVFALGCVLFECLAGEPAFTGPHPMALLAKILYAEPRRVRDLRARVPAGLDALIASMMAKEPSARPGDAAEVAAALRALRDVGAAQVTTRRSATALTEGERRLISVVFLDRSLHDDSPASTLRASMLSREDRALSEAAEAHGGRLSILAGGSAVVTISEETGAATDQAMRAARCALALRAIHVGYPMSLSTGRSETPGELPVSEAIDRAAEMLPEITKTPEGASLPIAIDDLTAALLDARFDVREGEAGLELHGERALAAATRTLLGKATRCVGRDREIGTLSAVFADCVEERVARVMLVTAAAGVGKSRLAAEFLRTIEQRRDAVEVWFGRGDALQAGGSFGVLGQALQGAAGIARGEPLSVQQDKLRARVARHVAEGDARRVAEFLGELIGTPFPDEASAPLKAARKDPQLMGEQTARAFEDFLEAETAAHPVLLLLEDLQWGDRPTVRLITSALRSLKQRPWMVLALARPEVHDQFSQLWVDRGAQEIRLTQLTRKASERLVRQVLGDGLSPEVTARVVAQADGNAFYLEELIRAVAEGKGEALPETVLSMVQSRLMGLPIGARRILRAASVFGEAFWPGGVTALLGGDASPSTRVETWLSTLVEQEVLVRLPESRFPGEPTYAFRHALLREGAHAMLTADDLALGHRLAGEWLLARGESDPVALAEHFERGKDPARAGTFYLRAAERAHLGLDEEAATTYARRALEAGVPPDLRIVLLGLLCDIYLFSNTWHGKGWQVDPPTEEVFRLAAPGSQPWTQAAFAELACAFGRNDREAYARAAKRLLDAEPLPDALDGFSFAVTAAAGGLDYQGERDLADAVLERVRASIEPIAERAPVAWAWWNAAHGFRDATMAEDPWMGLSRAQEARARFREADHRRGALMAQVYIGMNYWFLGAHSLAEHELETIPVSDDRLGIIAAYRPCALAGALADRSALPEARLIATGAVEMGLTVGDRPTEGRGRWALAGVLLRLGELDAAEREAMAAIDALASIPLEHVAAISMLAAVALAQGRAEEALAAAQGALDRARAMGACGLFRGAFLRLVHAEALHARGRVDEARAAIAGARARILAIAEKIGDPAIRRSFLQQVPENARTLTLARAWA